MDLLSLVLSCSISTLIDDRLIASIIDEESFGNTFYVRSEGNQYGIGYETLQAAIEAVERLNKDEKEVYIGLMGIPYDAGKNAVSDPKALFTACNNIALGTGIIDILSEQCKTEGRRDLVTCFIKKYAHKTDRQPTQFVENVIHKSALIGKNNIDKSPETAEIFVDLNDKTNLGNGVFLDYENRLKQPKTATQKNEKRGPKNTK